MFITKAEAARHLGIDVKTLDRMVAKGHLKTIDVNGYAHPKIKWESVKDYKRERAGTLEDGTLVYDLPYMTLQDMTQAFDFSPNYLYQIVRKNGWFPHIYREAEYTTSRYRIPLIDVSEWARAKGHYQAFLNWCQVRMIDPDRLKSTH